LSPAVGSISVSIRHEDGAVHEERWAAGIPDAGITRAVPWRTFRWRHGQEHYSGTYWSSVMSGHVIYESRLELTRLLYADFDRGTEAVLAQPFLLSARVDGGKRRHVPDFLVLRRGRVPLVVDVKPRHLLARPKVSFSLGWAREAVESRGWEFEAWSEPPEAELANVRFLAGYRRAWLFDPELVAEIRGADLDGATLREAFRAFPRRPAELVRAGVLHLLWAQHLVTDLATPLSARHRLRAGIPAEVTGAGTRELPPPAAVGEDRGKAEHEKAGSADRGAHMGQAGVRVGVGTRFVYDGEVVAVVEMFASASGNEMLVRDGRDRRFRLSLREVLASGRARGDPGRSRPVFGRAARDGIGDPRPAGRRGTEGGAGASSGRERGAVGIPVRVGGACGAGGAAPRVRARGAADAAVRGEGGGARGERPHGQALGRCLAPGAGGSAGRRDTGP